MGAQPSKAYEQTDPNNRMVQWPPAAPAGKDTAFTPSELPASRGDVEKIVESISSAYAEGAHERAACELNNFVRQIVGQAARHPDHPDYDSASWSDASSSPCSLGEASEVDQAKQLRLFKFFREAVGIKVLVQLLTSTSDRAKVAAAGALRMLSAMEYHGEKLREVAYFETLINRHHIVMAGGVQALVPLLTSGIEPAKMFAAATLWNLSDTGEAKDHPKTVSVMQLITEAEGVEGLVQMLESGLAISHATELLTTLASSSHNKELIRNAGGIKCLVRLLKSCKKGTEAPWSVVKAVGSLGHADPANQQLILELGGVDALLSFLHTDRRLLYTAGDALVDLARDNLDIKLHVLRVYGVGKLVALLNNDNFASVTGLLKTLVDDVTIQQMIVRAGDIEKLVSLLKRAKSPRQKRMVLDLLESFKLNDADNQKRFMAAGAIEALVQAVSVDRSVAKQAGRMLSSLYANNPGNAQQFYTSLVRLLEFNADTVKAAATEALCTLVDDNPDFQWHIKALGGIPKLAQLLVRGINAINPAQQMAVQVVSDTSKSLLDTDASHFTSVICQQSLKAMRSFAADPVNHQHIIQAGVLKALLHVLRSGASEEIGTAAAEVLGMLASVQDNQQGIMQAGFVKQLIQLLSWSAVLKQCAAVALQALASGGLQYKLDIANAGAIPYLVSNLASGLEPARKAAAGALQELSWKCDEAQTKIQAVGGINVLCDVLEDSGLSCELKCLAASILGNMAWDEQLAGMITCKNAVQLIMQLPEPSTSVFTALGSLCVLPDNQEVIMQAGQMPLLVQELVKLLHCSSADRVAEESARALCFLTKPFSEKILEAGAVMPLLALLKSSTTDVLAWSIEVLAGLAEQSLGCRETIREMGAEPHLETALNSGSEVVIKHAQRIMNTLQQPEVEYLKSWLENEDDNTILGIPEELLKYPGVEDVLQVGQKVYKCWDVDGQPCFMKAPFAHKHLEDFLYSRWIAEGPSVDKCDLGTQGQQQGSTKTSESDASGSGGNIGDLPGSSNGREQEERETGRNSSGSGGDQDGNVRGIGASNGSTQQSCAVCEHASSGIVLEATGLSGATSCNDDWRMTGPHLNPPAGNSSFREIHAKWPEHKLKGWTVTTKFSAYLAVCQHGSLAKVVLRDMVACVEQTKQTWNVWSGSGTWDVAMRQVSMTIAVQLRGDKDGKGKKSDKPAIPYDFTIENEDICGPGVILRTGETSLDRQYTVEAEGSMSAGVAAPQAPVSLDGTYRSATTQAGQSSAGQILPLTTLHATTGFMFTKQLHITRNITNSILTGDFMGLRSLDSNNRLKAPEKEKEVLHSSLVKPIGPREKGDARKVPVVMLVSDCLCANSTLVLDLKVELDIVQTEKIDQKLTIKVHQLCKQMKKVGFTCRYELKQPSPSTCN